MVKNLAPMENPTTSSKQTSHGVILVGHGGVPTDCPSHLVRKLKQLEAQRRASGQEMTAEERELDTQIRQWPRTPKTDPYRAGLESLGTHLKPLLSDALFALAYNEFCAPTLEDAAADLIGQGALEIVVISSMLTPGGSHSEIEIPETLDHLRTQFPQVVIRYAWPFDLPQVAQLLVAHVKAAP